MIHPLSLSKKWPQKTLAEVAVFMDGKRKPVKESERKPGPYPYYGANGQQGTIDGFIFDEPIILIAEDGGHFRQPDRGIAYKVTGKSWVNNHAHVLKPKDDSIDIDYLLYHLRHYDVTPFISGTTRDKLTKGSCEKIPILCPPIDIQQSIVERLNFVRSSQELRNQQISDLDNYLRSLFIEMFIDSKASKSWPNVKIEDLAANLSNSLRTGPFGSDLKHSEFVEDGVAVLGIDNVVSNEFRWDERRYITERKYEKLKRYTVRPGDVLITIMGTVGRSCVVPDDIPLSVNTKHLAAITLDQEKALPEFISKAFLIHPEIAAQLKRSEKGAIMAGLNLGIIKGLEFNLPPLELQRIFARSVESLVSLKKKLCESQTELNKLYGSVLSESFNT